MSAADQPVYLDHNASTPTLPEVVRAMLPWLTDQFGNPSSTHPYGMKLTGAVEKARNQVAELIGASPECIFFTSGGTESNNLAIRGLAAARPERKHILTSAIEHPATLAPCALLERKGYRIDHLGIDDFGMLDPGEAVTRLCVETLLVTVAQANSETGTIQPIGEIAGAAHAAGCLVHVDAAQSVGKIPVSVQRGNIDLLSVAGHKLYAPKGVGALYVRPGLRLEPVLVGAGHERGLRPGTENVAAIAGLGEACVIARRDLERESARVRALRDELWSRLCEGIPGLALNGHPRQRLPNTLNVRFPGVSGNSLLRACPEVAASTGSACHSDRESASPVILAMGVPGNEAIGSVRLSLGRATTDADILRASTALLQGWRSLQSANS